MKNSKNKLNWKPLIIILVVCGIITASYMIVYIDFKEAYVSENTSNTGVVIEKDYRYPNMWRNIRRRFDTRFFVTIERATVNYKGETKTSREQHILTYEDWIEIEVGDIATYNENGSISFGNADSAQK